MLYYLKYNFYFRRNFAPLSPTADSFHPCPSALRESKFILAKKTQRQKESLEEDDFVHHM